MRRTEAKSYARLSLVEKEATQRDRIREPAITCPRCETQTSPGDLVRHITTRCTGRREEIHPASKWITRSAALKWIPEPTLHRWASRGMVRQRGEGRGRREYLLRDLARNLAMQKRR